MAVLSITYLLMPFNPTCAYGQREAEVAVNEFIVKEQDLWQQRRQGKLSAKDWDDNYMSLIESEANRVKTLMPDVLTVIGGQLQYSSEDDRRLEELLKLSHPTVEEAMEVQSLLKEKSREKRIPRCGLAFLTGYLGRLNPKDAVDVLLSSVPAPESSEDMCFVRALMVIGPTAYEPILSKTLPETNVGRLYVGVMALAAQATKTDFPVVAGIGPQEQWDRSFPKSRRRLRDLAHKWESWWSANESKYVWNVESSLLEPK